MSRAWFNALHERALTDGVMKHAGEVSGEGLRTFVRNYFARKKDFNGQELPAAAPPLADTQGNAGDAE